MNILVRDFRFNLKRKSRTGQQPGESLDLTPIAALRKGRI